MISVEEIDAWLPQTQCQSCEYPDCRSYAEAIQQGEAEINRCPPGGETTLRNLASLLKRPQQALNADLKPFNGYKIAHIVEQECIGCAKCIRVCPVDAIVGSGKRMHTVISNACTGCELCIPPCPVDCIELQQSASTESDHRWPSFPRQAAERFRKDRRRHLNRASLKAGQRTKSPQTDTRTTATTDLQAEMLAAVARGRQRRLQRRK